VQLDLAAFTNSLTTLQVVIAADPGGFVAMDSPAMPGAGVQLATRVHDAASPALDLVVTFSKDAGYVFTQSMQVRLTTGNREDLQISATVTGLDDKAKAIASAATGAARLLPAQGVAT